MRTLIELLTDRLSYDASIAVYAEKIDGEFAPESPARFGRSMFENGGVIDNCKFFATNIQISNFIEAWTDGDSRYFEEVAIMLIEMFNASL